MMRAQKEESVKGLQSDMSRATVALFVDYTGLTVEEVTNLRRKFRGLPEIGFRVVKNTLMKRAIAGTPYEGASKTLKGTPTGVVFGFKDPVATAKATFEFLKETEHLKLKGGVFDNKAISAKEAEALSKLPSREELIAGILGMIMGPGRRVAAQIKNPAGRVVGAIETKAKGEEKAAG